MCLEGSRSERELGRLALMPSKCAGDLIARQSSRVRQGLERPAHRGDGAHHPCDGGCAIDGFLRDGKADLIQQFAYALPGFIICDLLGVPRSDMEQLKRWSDDKTLLMSATAPLEQQVQSAHGFIAMERYFREQLHERRRHPREDLLTLLVPQSLGGTAPLSEQEAVCNAMDLFAAGHETTTGLIGTGMWLLFKAPEQ